MEKKKLGFSVMTTDKQREIAVMGGKSAPDHTRSFRNPEVARAAALKSAEVRRAKAWAAKQHLLEKMK